MIPFAKGHGLGNDYLVLDRRDLPGELSARAIQRICDRNRGVGSAGILLRVASVRADFADVAGTILTVTAVSVGNPHCVVFVERLDEGEVRRLGPLVERHPAFPNRTNVQFARVRARDTVDVLVWERGAGWTLASGSSACAVASAAVRNDLTDGRMTIRMPGGPLAVEVRPDWSLRLEGPVEEICTGVLSPELERHL